MRKKKKNSSKIDMLLLAPFAVSGMLFGHFAASFPPHQQQQQVKVNIVTETNPKLFNGAIVPIRPPSFIACEDDDCILHYFLHRQNILYRCLWGRDISCSEKIKIFTGLHDWMNMASNTTLMATFSSIEDASAWDTCSDLVDK